MFVYSWLFPPFTKAYLLKMGWNFNFDSTITFQPLFNIVWQSLKNDRNITACIWEGVDSSKLILQYIYDWFSPTLENWLRFTTANNVLKIICHFNVELTANVQQFFNPCRQLLRISWKVVESQKLNQQRNFSTISTGVEN